MPEAPKIETPKVAAPLIPIAPIVPAAPAAPEVEAPVIPAVPGHRQYVAVEDPNKPTFEFKVETAETIFKEKDWSEPPVNQRFIFHNKMPKCGSTVFQKLLKKLSIINKFTFLDVYEPGTRDQVIVSLKSEAEKIRIFREQEKILKIFEKIRASHWSKINFIKL